MRLHDFDGFMEANSFKSRLPREDAALDGLSQRLWYGRVEVVRYWCFWSAEQSAVVRIQSTFATIRVLLEPSPIDEVYSPVGVVVRRVECACMEPVWKSTSELG